MTDQAMRVVQITTVPESLIGFLRGFAEYLRARDIQITAISSPGDHLQTFKDSNARHAVETIGITMPRKITPMEDLSALWKLFRAIGRARPTIVHAHTPKGGLLGMIAAAAARVPVRIYHMRGLPLETATGPTRTLMRLTEWTSCRLATHVLCVSRSLRERAIAEKVVHPEKIEVLAKGSGQGVDASYFTPLDDTRAARTRFQVPHDAIVVGFIGRLVRDKGILELLEAWRLLRDRTPNLHLLVAGAVEERDALPAAAMTLLREDPRIHFVGFTWDARALYSAMDIVVLPTYREGFPNVPLEAAAMEKPVVATRVSGCVDAVVDEQTGLLVEARDATALAHAIARYVDDPMLRRRHGRAARVRVLSDFRPELLWDATYQTYVRLVDATTPRLSAVKRLFDFVAAGAALIVLSPVLGASALAIRLTMGSPVLFKHSRPGLSGRLFMLYKLRTMRAPQAGEGIWYRTDEERLTRVGRFLRSTSLDELPGLWNVLRGDMSLVGPRPLLKEYLPRYTPEQRRRHAVRPGITGWAQVHGRQTIVFSKRIEYDLWYVDNRSFVLDLKILAMTLRDVFAAKGVIPGQNVDDVDDLGLVPDRPTRQRPTS